MSNLRFTDNIVLLSHDIQELCAMAVELSVESEKVGLTINMAKTKIMTNSLIETSHYKMLSIENKSSRTSRKVSYFLSRSLYLFVFAFLDFYFKIFLFKLVAT